MDLTTFRTLLTAAGHRVIADAEALQPTEAGFLSAFEKLRARHPPDLAKAALETVLLRARARDKHENGNHLYFTREALEQSSGELVSRYRADRFRPYRTVLDLCCGVGMDAIRLGLAGCAVEAVESDALRLAMAEANAAASVVADRIHFHLGDVLTMPLSAADAAFVDPSRREGERRFLDPERFTPPLGAVLARFPAGFPLAAKIAPGVARADIVKYDAEAEFVSAGGELRECVLWFGPLRTAKHRATVLPGPHSLVGDRPPAEPEPGAIQEYVFDPDPAVIRAGLVGLLAVQLGAVPVDHGIAVLTGPRRSVSRFAACYHVEYAAPFHVGNLREYLRERGVGRVTLLKRAVALDVNEVTQKLKLDGSEHRHVVLARALGKTVAIVAVPAAA